MVVKKLALLYSTNSVIGLPRAAYGIGTFSGMINEKDDVVLKL